MPAIGTCFQLLINDEAEQNHFWVVVSEPIDGQVLIVNLTGREKCPDSPCHFAIGEHPAIIKPSVIYYYKARTHDAAIMDAQLGGGRYFRVLAPFSADLVNRIREGARNAEDLTLKFLKFVS